MICVQQQLRAVGLVAWPDDEHVRYVAVPVEHLAVFSAISRARGQREGAEVVIAKLLAVISAEPNLAVNIFDEDDATLGIRIGLELAKAQATSDREAEKVERSVALKRAAAGATSPPSHN